MKHWSLGQGACLLAAIVLLIGCKKDAGDNQPGNLQPAGAGSVAMMGGAGAAGMAMGTAGMGTAGMGTAGMGTAGTTAPAGGLTCAGADMTAAPAALHAAAAEVLTMMSPCGFGSCHVGTGKAGLILLGATDLKTLLVGKPACEAPNLSLIDATGGDVGLQKSYLWLKLTAPANAGTGAINPDTTWGMGTTCGTTPSAPYGVRMPQSGTDMKASDERLGKIRNWICAGAPGPT